MSGFRTRSNSPGTDNSRDETTTQQQSRSESQQLMIQDQSRQTVDETSQEMGQKMYESTLNETSSEDVDLASIYVNGKYIGEVQTEEQRRLVHEQMKKRLEMLSYQTKPQTSNRYLPVLLPQIQPKITPFANDGSFLERFKQMQQQYEQQPMTSSAPTVTDAVVAGTMVTELKKQAPPKPVVPMVGRRRGGKILKTGVVEKPKKIGGATDEVPTDAWSLYTREVQRYKAVVCDEDSGRPLVK